MTKKGLFAIFLIIALLFLVVSANALPKIFPNVQFPIGGNQGNMFGDYEDLLTKPGPRISFLKQSGNQILICKSPAGYDWSEFDKGKSQCLLPEGAVMAGDVIKNCEGTVTIIHKATNEIAISATFTDPLTEEEKEKQDTDPDPVDQNKDDENNQDTQEKTQFEIKITKPAEKKSYIRDIQLKERDNTLVIGNIDVETDITNPDNIGIQKVVFSVDNKEKYTDDEGPTYSWSWDEKIFGKHTITVSVYDKKGNLLDSDEIKITILNFDIL